MYIDESDEIAEFYCVKISNKITYVSNQKFQPTHIRISAKAATAVCRASTAIYVRHTHIHISCFSLNLSLQMVKTQSAFGCGAGAIQQNWFLTNFCSPFENRLRFIIANEMGTQANKQA